VWSWVVVLLIVSQELLQQTIFLTEGTNGLNLKEGTLVKTELLSFNRGLQNDTLSRALQVILGKEQRSGRDVRHIGTCFRNFNKRE
jgi:hypothetical protein